MVGQQSVGSVRRLLHQFFDSGDIQHFTVVEVDFVYTVSVGSIVFKIRAHCYFAVVVFCFDNQMIAVTDEAQRIDRDAVGKADNVFATGGCVVVADGILTETLTEDIGVVTGTAAQVIVAASADQGVVAFVTIQGNVFIIAQAYVL